MRGLKWLQLAHNLALLLCMQQLSKRQNAAATHNDCLWLRSLGLLLSFWKQQERLDALHGRNGLCNKKQMQFTSEQHAWCIMSS